MTRATTRVLVVYAAEPAMHGLVTALLARADVAGVVVDARPGGYRVAATCRPVPCRCAACALGWRA